MEKVPAQGRTAFNKTFFQGPSKRQYNLCTKHKDERCFGIWMKCLTAIDRMVSPVKNIQQFWCGKPVTTRKCKTLLWLLPGCFFANLSVITYPETQLMVSFLVGLGGSQSDHHHAKSHDFSLSKSLPTMLVICEADLVKNMQPCQEEELIPFRWRGTSAKDSRCKFLLTGKKDFTRGFRVILKE